MIKNSNCMLPAICFAAGVLAGCSSASAPSGAEAQIPPAQNYDVKIQPARISPNPQGAFALSSLTGCDVVYVGRNSAPDTITYAVRPTSRVPDAAQCAARLREQPGVEMVSAAR